jgi:hypothetical protein
MVIGRGVKTRGKRGSGSASTMFNVEDLNTDAGVDDVNLGDGYTDDHRKFLQDFL